MKSTLSRFWTLENINEFINTVIREEKLDAPSEVYVKSRASRGKNAGTWMHPILFIKYAMWINPEFEYFVIKFVSDQLIQFRHDAGDLYRVLGRAVGVFKDANYAQIAKGLNHIVFGLHDRDLRQQAVSEFFNKKTSATTHNAEKVVGNMIVVQDKEYCPFITKTDDIISNNYFNGQQTI